jgi:polyhydroxyalkanoate synthesis regulator protein
LVGMLQHNLRHETERGNPLTPLQQLCAFLSYYGGGQFQRITGKNWHS